MLTMSALPGESWRPPGQHPGTDTVHPVHKWRRGPSPSWNGPRSICRCHYALHLHHLKSVHTWQLCYHATGCGCTVSLGRGVEDQIWALQSKTQAMTIAHHRQPWQLPGTTFDATPVSEAGHLKLLGVTFVSQLTYAQHIHTINSRAQQRLGFLRKASAIVEPPGRLRAYNGFDRLVLEYCPLVWLGAPPSHLAKLDQIQWRAIHIIGSWLPSRSLRRTVASLAYLYKLFCLDADSPLKKILPPGAQRRPQDIQPTRVSAQPTHPHQLSTNLPARTRNSCPRAFPASAVQTWNALPQSILLRPPHLEGLQAFKCRAHRHLQLHHWSWATESL